jgi:PPOX class probable F420-dependent enzyme
VRFAGADGARMSTRLDFNSRLGRRVNRRLIKEHIIWLTTVGARGVPYPRPVWFHWDGRTVLIFSQEGVAKARHIARNPNVALNFNTDEDGGDVAILIGEATILRRPPSPDRVKAYLRKYRQGINDIGMTVATFASGYRVAILVKPKAMRGF